MAVAERLIACKDARYEVLILGVSGLGYIGFVQQTSEGRFSREGRSFSLVHLFLPLCDNAAGLRGLRGVLLGSRNKYPSDPVNNSDLCNGWPPSIAI